MKKAIFAALAALSVSLAAAALAPVANAYTSVFPPSQGGDGGSGAQG